MVCTGHFDVQEMNRVLDLSNDAYPAILERHRRYERARAILKSTARVRRPLWRKILDYVLG